MNKTLLALLLSLALTACGQPGDLTYNEVVTAAFLSNVQRIDRDMEGLINGDFDPGHGAGRGALTKHPGDHIAELEKNLNQVQQLPHSEDASQFASRLSRYYELQIGYYQQLKRYVETTDPAKKETLAQSLATTYQGLRGQPEQILAAQKQFLERASRLH
ncbi:hypothetical protein UB43_17400 [Pseudomonas sp. 21]|uniref:LPS translocon maturation chaperone LptM n=1 Tax=unclassified Pseudomonas TaxID=196821 RepID=UPI0005EB783B|nr:MULTISPECIES: hypothetical protein [unclassified Pseudomonas]KJJ98452.1 hypothetical protein UB43_17400 [Pseudomonas sp. 21]MBV7584202.1 hypothetical protein [Pseudomonas sp. PDM33]